MAKGANFSKDEWLFKRLNFMDKQIWVTQYNPDERYPEGNIQTVQLMIQG